MKVNVVCAWCDTVKEIKYIPDSNHTGKDPIEEITTHSICKVCADRLLAAKD